MPGDAGLIKLKLRNNLAAAELPFGKQAQDLKAYRMRQHLPDLSDLLIERILYVIVIHSSMHRDIILLPWRYLAKNREPRQSLICRHFVKY